MWRHQYDDELPPGWALVRDWNQRIIITGMKYPVLVDNLIQIFNARANSNTVWAENRILCEVYDSCIWCPQKTFHVSKYSCFCLPLSRNILGCRLYVLKCAVRLSINIYFAWRDGSISLFSGWISNNETYARNTVYPSANCWEDFQCHEVKGQGHAATTIEMMWTG